MENKPNNSADQANPNTRTGELLSWEDLKTAQKEMDYNRETYGPGTDREASVQKIVDSMPPGLQAKYIQLHGLKKQYDIQDNKFDDRAASLDWQIKALEAEIANYENKKEVMTISITQEEFEKLSNAGISGTAGEDYSIAQMREEYGIPNNGADIRVVVGDKEWLMCTTDSDFGTVSSSSDNID